MVPASVGVSVTVPVGFPVAPGIPAAPAPPEFTPRPPEGTPAPGRPAGGVVLNVPSLVLHNPGSHELVSLDLTHPVALETLPHPSLYQLLLGLRQVRASGTLVAHGPKPATVGLDRGLVMASDAAAEALTHAAQLPEVTITIKPEAAPPVPGARRRDPYDLCATAMRDHLHLMRTEELDMLLGHPRLGYLHKVNRPAGSYSPKLNQKEKRFMDVVVDGKRMVVDVPAVSGLPKHLTWQLLILLRAFGWLEFREDPAAGAESLATRVADDRVRLAKSNLFERVGGHWSDHPSSLAQRYKEMVKKYGPGSHNAKIAPEDSAAICALAKEASQKLSSYQGRKEARTFLGGLDLSAAADILVKHSELSAMRKEWSVVLQFLEAAVELYPSQGNRQLLETAQAELEKARTKAMKGEK